MNHVQNVVKNSYLFRITFWHIFDKKVLVSQFGDQGTIKKVINNVQNIQEHVLDKFWVQLMRLNLLKHEKTTNGPPPGLTDKSVPGRYHIVLNRFQKVSVKQKKWNAKPKPPSKKKVTKRKSMRSKIFCSVWSLDIIRHYTNSFGGKQRVKNFLDTFKIQNSPSKVIKCQNILPITTFENVEKMQSSHVLEAQIISTCRMALLFCSVCSLDICMLISLVRKVDWRAHMVARALSASKDDWENVIFL